MRKVVKSVFLLAVTTVSFVAAGAEPAFDTLIAHSGCSDAPKNTAAAFRDSVARGFGIECDVRLSSDGRLFTFHDDTLTRLTDGVNTNAVYEMTWNEIAKLNVAGEKWRGTGFDPARPALFEEEVLPLARDGRWLFVEVKPEAGIEIVPHLKKALARQRKATPKNTLFISFSGDICKELKKQMPEYKALYLTTVYIGGKRYNRYKDPRNLIADLRTMGVDGVDAPFYNKKSMNLQTAEYIKTVKDAGFEYHAWTCNSLDQVRIAFERGMDTVTTDLPETILREYRAGKVKLDTSSDRVKTPLVVDMERIGTLRPRSVGGRVQTLPRAARHQDDPPPGRLGEVREGEGEVRLRVARQDRRLCLRAGHQRPSGNRLRQSDLQGRRRMGPRGRIPDERRGDCRVGRMGGCDDEAFQGARA